MTGRGDQRPGGAAAQQVAFEAALKGGFDAWKAAYPTEPVTEEAVR